MLQIATASSLYATVEDDLYLGGNTETILDEEQTQELASFIKECKVTQKDLATTTRHYIGCIEKDGKSLQWWQKPQGGIGIAIVSFLIGFSVSSN